MVAVPTNVGVTLREDDGAIEIGTNSYVFHKRGTPWQSSFTMSLEDAEKLWRELGAILNRHAPHEQEG